MKRKTLEKLELEAELLKLNALVRERREELARIKDCPNHDCHCRAVWKEQVDKTLAGQVRKIRRRLDDGKKKKTGAKV
jgi:hypothetical protein